MRELLRLVLEAHAASARENDCVSSAAVRNCNAGNPLTLSGIASAILTVGLIHAPATDARRVFSKTSSDIDEMLMIGGHPVSGFGNSFFAHGDPEWFPVRKWLMVNFRSEYNRLVDHEAVMFTKSPNLHANAAMYTAICCELLQIPHGQEALLFILPRLPVWFTL